MKQTYLPLTVLVGAVLILAGFQNCSKASFSQSPALQESAVTPVGGSGGAVTTPSDPSTTAIPTSSGNPLTSVPNGDDSDSGAIAGDGHPNSDHPGTTPSGSGGGTVSGSGTGSGGHGHSGGDDVDSSSNSNSSESESDDDGKDVKGGKDGEDGQVLCYITKPLGHGNSARVGFSSVQSRCETHGVPEDVCMSPHACLDIVNLHLNKTGGSLANRAGATSSPLVQYTAIKSNGVCAHNPNVQHMDDDHVSIAVEALNK
jgi:hypothetical protein